MKIIASTLITATISIFLISCGSNEGKQSTNGIETTLESVMNSASLDKDAKGQNSCLMKYQSKYDQLFSEQDILKVTGFDPAKLETDYNQFMDDPAFHSYTYSFDNGRVGKIPGTDREMKQSDYVAIKYIEEMSYNQFEFNYKVPTDEDIEASKKTLTDVVDGKIESEAAKDALKQAEEKNVSKDMAKSIGSAMVESFAEIAQHNVKVDNLGDAAVWNKKEFSLNVLKNGVKFCIEANVSNDIERNREVAIALAKIILEKCN